MLILTRRVSEVICIGDNIEVAVLDVRGNQVRMGIKAPKEIQVHRQEVYERIKRGEPIADVLHSFDRTA